MVMASEPNLVAHLHLQLALAPRPPRRGRDEGDLAACVQVLADLIHGHHPLDAWLRAITGVCTFARTVLLNRCCRLLRCWCTCRRRRCCRHRHAIHLRGSGGMQRYGRSPHSVSGWRLKLLRLLWLLRLLPLFQPLLQLIPVLRCCKAPRHRQGTLLGPLGTCRGRRAGLRLRHRGEGRAHRIAAACELLQRGLQPQPCFSPNHFMQDLEVDAAIRDASEHRRVPWPGGPPSVPIASRCWRRLVGKGVALVEKDTYYLGALYRKTDLVDADRITLLVPVIIPDERSLAVEY
mmetsp:Transcript_8398/g.23201  ORF Transcript_8398/g.23201 Transcript_8398/m.23201 type:complete len:291 (+) Transcript_8398:433-1305(+)